MHKNKKPLYNLGLLIFIAFHEVILVPICKSSVENKSHKWHISFATVSDSAPHTSNETCGSGEGIGRFNCYPISLWEMNSPLGSIIRWRFSASSVTEVVALPKQRNW